jgi:hypothetical protein
LGDNVIFVNCGEINFSKVPNFGKVEYLTEQGKFDIRGYQNSMKYIDEIIWHGDHYNYK